MGGAVFILGPGRSLTSVTAGMLGQHPELFGLPETNLAIADTVDEWLTNTRNGNSGFAHGVLRVISQLAEGSQTADGVARAWSWLDANRAMTTDRLIAMIAEQVAPRRLVEKSPLHGARDDYLARLERFFPDARYIHITRHPRPSCESMMKAEWYQMVLRIGVAESWDRRSQPPVFDPQVHWWDMHDRIGRFLAGIPAERQTRVRGEDVLGDEDTIRSLCQFLEIDDGPAALDAMRHPERSPFACEGPPNARFGNDPSYQESPQLRPWRPVAAHLKGPLPWRPDGAGFATEVIDMAQRFGYAS